MMFAVLFGMQQVVLELAPLVAGDGRMDQIIPLAPELDAIAGQQRDGWMGCRGEGRMAGPSDSVGRLACNGESVFYLEA